MAAVLRHRRLLPPRSRRPLGARRPWTPCLGSGSGLGAPAAVGGVRLQEARREFFFGRREPQRFLDIEGLDSANDWPRLAQEAVAAARAELDGAGDRGALDLVLALDNASNGLCRIADAAELCRNVHPDGKHVEMASEAVGCIASYMGEVNFDCSIYEGLLRHERSQHFAEMPLEPRAVLSHMRVSMEHEGIHLPEDEKAECLQLQELEQQLSFTFVQGQEQRRQDSENNGLWIPLAGATEALGTATASRLPKRSAADSAGKAKEEVKMPAEQMWTEQILRHSRCSESRRLAYEAQHAEDQEGEDTMAELLRVRQRLAQIRGYKNWNEYAQRESLFQTPERVGRFLDAAWERLRPGVLADLRKLADEKQSAGLDGLVLQPWDIPYLLQRSRANASAAEGRGNVSEYLSYGSLMKGVDLITTRLLGLGLRPEEPKPGEVWHPSVQKYVLRDGERTLGILYMDPFARQGKTVQSAQFTVQGSKILNQGERQTPITTLVYSFHPSKGGLPVSHAVTFMHEIGHALHSLISETELQHLSGTRGTIDFVEFPSHLFEHFVLDPSCLATYATHATTGATLPADVQQRYRQESTNFAHFEAAQQLLYAAADQAFYTCLPPNSGATSETNKRFATAVQDSVKEALARFDRDLGDHGIAVDAPLAALLGISRPSKFDHLVHYGGSYYCYLFNRALSAHVWRHGFKDDPFGSEPGQRLRTLLKGGSVDQRIEVIEALCPGAGGFRAHEVPLDAFVEQLGG